MGTNLRTLSNVTSIMTMMHAAKISMPRAIVLSILRESELTHIKKKGGHLSDVPHMAIGEIEARYREKTREISTGYKYESIRNICHVMSKSDLLRKSKDGQYVEYRLTKTGREIAYTCGLPKGSEA